MAAQIRTHNPVYLSLEYDDGDEPSAWEKRMEEKALRQRWPISEAKRVAIVERLLGVVENPATEDFNLVAAAKALISADRLNVEQQKIDLANQPPEQINDNFVIDISQDDPAQPGDEATA